VFLDELIIRNFGLFRGAQKLDFTPHNIEQPVILIGGLNGSGKTTLLDAIQLALYGKRARISNRGSLSYEEYLRRSMHNESETEETSITLQFRRWEDGKEQIFCIRRNWNLVKQLVVENVAVMRNGVFDKYLTDTWTEFVEEIIPVEIAQLFFFDGEKIEGFADPETSKQLLSKAVSTLLGLDVVTRLQADLLALERRKQVALKSDKDKEKITDLELALKNLEDKIEDLNQVRGGQQNQLERRRIGARKAFENYNQSGGSLFDQREEFEKERAQLKNELRENENALREVTEGSAPLLLVSDLLGAMQQQHNTEEQAAKSALVNQTLSERDAEFLRLVESLKIPDAASNQIENFLQSDRTRRTESAKAEIYLNLSPEGFQDLRNLQTLILPQVKNSIQILLAQNSEIQIRLVDAERKLASVPAQDFVLELIKQRDIANEALANVEKTLLETDAEIKRLGDEYKIFQDKLTALLENNVTERFEAEDANRVVEHSRLARETMAKFRQSVTARHTGRIAALVLDSFRHLLRKESLISDLTIDAETFAVRISDASGRSLSPDRLSAGERQLLAVSLLWGLARASGYPLPVAVDTPLGRLDSVHRDNLVENYFPQASHQVILLSTNKEIDAELYHKLEPFVGHSYRLEYNDELKATQIKPGYFEDLWQSNTSDFRSRQKTNSLNSNV
jgi:DNA sulfur modification protein DndD